MQLKLKLQLNPQLQTQSTTPIQCTSCYNSPRSNFLADVDIVSEETVGIGIIQGGLGVKASSSLVSVSAVVGVSNVVEMSSLMKDSRGL